MAKKKRAYRKKTRAEKEVDQITWVLVWIVLLWFYFNHFLKSKFIDFFDKNQHYFYLSFLLFLCLIFLFLYLKIRKHFQLKQEKINKINQLPEFVKNIKGKIDSFKPLRDYTKEEPYQIELSWYLKNFFPNLDIEISKNYTRPDIIIDNIAIEIKWPTNFSDLKTIPDKIIRYTKEWDYLIIVLFNLKLHDNLKKSDEIYENWKQDIEENFQSKLDRIMFIKI